MTRAAAGAGAVSGVFEVRAERLPCGAVSLRRGAYAAVLPADTLPGWLRFYRRMRDRRGGAYAGFYAPVVTALEALGVVAER